VLRPSPPSLATLSDVAAIARHVIECHSTQETRDRNACQ
jgi:hypothetical protein